MARETQQSREEGAQEFPTLAQKESAQRPWNWPKETDEQESAASAWEEGSNETRIGCQWPWNKLDGHYPQVTGGAEDIRAVSVDTTGAPYEP